MATVKHYHHHYNLSYNTSLQRHFSAIALVVAALFLIFLYIFHLISATTPFSLNEVSPLTLVSASINTLFRLSLAYILAIICSIPLALLITSTPKLEKVLLPIFDIVQSIPALAFFPIIVLLFLQFNFFEGAAIFILFMAMVWNLVFTMIGGLKTIPQDIKAAASVFGARGAKLTRFVTLPAVFPYLVTGSMLAWGQAWNIVIVAEVLHTYIPGSNSSTDLVGLGSLLANSTAQGKNSIFLASLAVMIILIGSLNFFIWQRLLRATERYKFD